MGGLTAAARKAAFKDVRPVAMTWRWFDYTDPYGRWLPAAPGHETPGVEFEDGEGFRGWCPIDAIPHLKVGDVSRWLASGRLSQDDWAAVQRLLREAEAGSLEASSAKRSKRPPSTHFSTGFHADGRHAYAVLCDGTVVARHPCGVIYTGGTGARVRWPQNPVVLATATMDAAAFSEAVRIASRRERVTVTFAGDGRATLTCGDSEWGLSDATLEASVTAPLAVHVTATTFNWAYYVVYSGARSKVVRLSIARRGYTRWLYAALVHPAEGGCDAMYEAYVYGR